MKTIEQRILEIEKLFYWAEGTQGTTISRVMIPNAAQAWAIGFGAMYQPKYFFQGSTIEEALDNAEAELTKILDK